MKGLKRYAAFVAGHVSGPFDAKKLPFTFISATEISLDYSLRGDEAIRRYTCRERCSSLCIDELGREPADAKHYGTGLNAIQAVLQLRYETRREAYTHATTNLDPDTDLSDRYGDYIADRAKEMFNVIHVITPDGLSRRQ